MNWWHLYNFDLNCGHKISQRALMDCSGRAATPTEANRMLVTKALPHDVALLAFVPL